MNELSKRGEFMNPVALQQIDAMATKFVDSKALPSTIQNGSQLAMVLMAGYEAGMRPMESINAYYIVNGKITIWGSAVIQQLRKAGWAISWGESTDKLATVTITNKKEKCTETYTIEDAAKAGLTSRDTWKKYAKSMLRHKAIAQAVRFTCPEVLGGFYMKEDVDDSPIDVQATVTTPQPKATKLPEKTNKAIHASWNEFGELKGWNKEQTEGARKKILAKLYSVQSNNDLTVQEAGEFLTKIAEQIKTLKATQTPAKPDDDQDFADQGETPDMEAEDAQEVIEAEIETDIERISSEDFAEILELAAKAGMDEDEIADYFQRLYKCTLETLPSSTVKGVKSSLKRRATMMAKKDKLDPVDVAAEDLAEQFGGSVIDEK